MSSVYVVLCKDYEGNISIHGVYSLEIMAEKFLNKFKEEYKTYKEIDEYISLNTPRAPGFPRKATEAALNSYRSQLKHYNEKMEKFNLSLQEKFSDKLDLIDKYKDCQIDPENCIIRKLNLDDGFIVNSQKYKI